MKVTFVDTFLIWLAFLLIGASPRIWSRTARRQHVASLLYQLAEVLRSMGNGGTFFGDKARMSSDFKFGLLGPANSGGSHLTPFVQLPPLIFVYPNGQSLRLHTTQNTPDVLFMRSTLFNVCSVGVYKCVSLPICPQAFWFQQHFSLDSLDVFPSH